MTEKHEKLNAKCTEIGKILNGVPWIDAYLVYVALVVDMIKVLPKEAQDKEAMQFVEDFYLCLSDKGVDETHDKMRAKTS